MDLSNLIDAVDFEAVHIAIAMAGMFLSVYLMAHTEAEDPREPRIIKFSRRFGLMVFGLACCWSVIYSESREWTPWPPDMVALAAIDAMLANRIVSVKLWLRRTTETKADRQKVASR